MKMGGNELEKLRGELSEITGSILRLIAERRRLSLRIGEVKAASGKPLLDREAEAALLRKMLNLCGELGLDEELCRRILLMLIEDSLNLQRTKLIEKKADPLAYRKIFARAAELYRMGKPVIRTEVGQPDFTAPPEVMAAAYEAMRKGYGRYAPAAGIPELRKALAENLSQRYGVDLKPENVVVTLGGAMAVYSAIEALTKPGDEVMVVEPAWPIYGHQSRTYGRRVVSAMTRLEDDWDPIKPLEEGLTEATRLVVVNYPNNPTGKVLSRKDFGRLLETASELGAWVLSDEVYRDFLFEGEDLSALQFPDAKTVVVGSFSKSWGMTGYRIGYLVAEEEVARRAALVQNTVATCVPEFVQYAAIEALKQVEVARKNVETVRRRLEVLSEELGGSNLIEFTKPQGAMYLFPRIKVDGLDSIDFAWKLLEKKGVGVAPGTSFGEGYSNYIRISAVRPVEELREAARKILEAAEEAAAGKL